MIQTEQIPKSNQKDKRDTQDKYYYYFFYFSPKLFAPRKQKFVQQTKHQARKGAPGSASTPKRDPAFRHTDRKIKIIHGLQFDCMF